MMTILKGLKCFSATCVCLQGNLRVPLASQRKPLRPLTNTGYFCLEMGWGFSYDVIKIQTRKLLILLRFYFRDVQQAITVAENWYSYKFSLRMGPWFW